MNRTISSSTDAVITELNVLVRALAPDKQGYMSCGCATPPLNVCLARLVEALRLEPEDLLCAAGYLRHLHSLPLRRAKLHPCTPYRLMAAALAVAFKFPRGNSHTNADLGRAIGLRTADVDRAERAMRKMLSSRRRVTDVELRIARRDFVHFGRSSGQTKLTREGATVADRYKRYNLRPRAASQCSA